MTVRIDALVIGGGAIGSATAWWLARRGRSVLLAERFPAGHTRGSSHGEVRIFRLAYPDVGTVRMAVEARALWRDLEDECGELLLDPIGAIDHGPPDALAPIAAALRVAGARHELLPPAAVAERWPGVHVEGTAIFHPAGGRSFADRTVAALQRRAAVHGAEIRHRCAARLVGRSGDHVDVDVDGQVVRARAVVVTAGAWVSHVLASLPDPPGLPPLTVTQETVVHFPAADPDAPWPSFIHHDAGLRYGLPSLTEGIKVGGHHEGAVTDPDERDFLVDPLQVQQLRGYVERWLPGVRPEPQFGASCLYTTTPDESFVVERHGRIVIGSACSGHGFKFTPLTGRRLADLADRAIGAG